MVHPTVLSVLLSASVVRVGVSCMRDFFCKVWLATSHRRKDLVVTKVVRLGGSRCRPTGEDGQKTLLVQKFRCNTVKMSISITLGSHSSRRAGLHPLLPDRHGSGAGTVGGALHLSCLSLPFLVNVLQVF